MAANSPAHRPGILSLIAAGEEEAVPPGVPYGALPLDSLDTPQVNAWVEENRQYAIYILAGAEFASEGVPAISVPASSEDYRRVLSAMPR